MLSAPGGDDLPIGDPLCMQASGLIGIAASAAHRVTIPRQLESNSFPRSAGRTAPPVLHAPVGLPATTAPVTFKASQLVVSPVTHHPRGCPVVTSRPMACGVGT
jgi:hypothetical protein